MLRSLAPQTNIQLGALVSAALGLAAGVAEALHPGLGLFPCGVAAGVWLASGWAWLTEA